LGDSPTNLPRSLAGRGAAGGRPGSGAGERKQRSWEKITAADDDDAGFIDDDLPQKSKSGRTIKAPKSHQALPSRDTEPDDSISTAGGNYGDDDGGAEYQPNMGDLNDIFGHDIGSLFDTTEYKTDMTQFIDEDYNEDDDGGERAGIALKDKKSKLQRRTSSRIPSGLDPAEAKLRFLTESDDAIRAKDVPERLFTRITRRPPLVSADSSELERKSAMAHEIEEEASWIFDQLGQHWSKEQLSHDKRDSVLAAIRRVLSYLRVDTFEIAFVETYRREYWHPILAADDLQKIDDLDDQWDQLAPRKHKLKAVATHLSFVMYVVVALYWLM
jgi:hypothetical protein